MPELDAAHRAAEAAARRSYGRLVAFLAARTRDIAGAEDALSEAFAAALTDWPAHGVPARPEAWLLTVARRKRIDTLRRQRGQDEFAAAWQLLGELASHEEPDGPAIPDERLAMMFACAHPAIDERARAPLMLQAVLGLDAAAIASAFLVAPATMGQRLVRAKAKIRQAGIPLRVPAAVELPGRLEAVLETIYAAYTEGWADPAGTDTRRRELADEALWLGRLVASLLPAEPEALGLFALMLYAHARRDARRDAQGRYVPLAAQDPARWDRAMLDQAEALLRRASRLGRVGRYQLEAALQSAHVRRRDGGGTDQAAITQLYDALFALTGSPVVGVNRAIALAESHGPAEALSALEAVAADARLHDYQPYWAARAELLERLNRRGEAAQACERAIGLEADPAVREFLQRRRAALG